MGKAYQHQPQLLFQARYDYFTRYALRSGVRKPLYFYYHDSTHFSKKQCDFSTGSTYNLPQLFQTLFKFGLNSIHLSRLQSGQFTFPTVNVSHKGVIKRQTLF